MNPVVVVLSSASSREEAERIAYILVQEYLAAAVNVLAGALSVYRWEGAITRTEECLLVIKTKRSALDLVLGRLVSLHSYRVPPIVVLPVESGYQPYLDWISSSVEDSWHEIG
jgi:periplasmic divalent cation tolerance protein